MEIRRAILLFAIVLGLAALVTSFTRPTEEQGSESSSEPAPRQPPRDEPSSPTASAESATRPAELRFPAGANAVTRSLESGRAGALTVDVLAPGQVAITDLGLDTAAQPGTPARFDVLADEPGRYPIEFTPANGADGRTIGVLRVRE